MLNIILCPLFQDGKAGKIARKKGTITERKRELSLRE